MSREGREQCKCCALNGVWKKEFEGDEVIVSALLASPGGNTHWDGPEDLLQLWDPRSKEKMEF